MKNKPDCYKCMYREELIGDCHSRCTNSKARVKGNQYGIKSGWFFYPFNFDPVWLESCDSFEEKQQSVKDKE